MQDQRAAEAERACLLLYNAFCKDKPCLLHVFTKDRHVVIVSLQQTHSRHPHIVCELDGMRIFRHPWVPRAFGFEDFKHMVGRVQEIAAQLHRCVHCLQFTGEPAACAKCAMFVTTGLYRQCIACQTDDHPIAWLCRTCIDSCYCTMCLARLAQDPVLCPTCKQPNAAIEEEKMVVVSIDTDSDDTSSDSDSDNEDSSPEISPFDRFTSYLQYHSSRGETRVVINGQILRECKHLTATDLNRLCRSLASHGYHTFLWNEDSSHWNVCVCFEDEPPPRLPCGSREFEPA